MTFGELRGAGVRGSYGVRWSGLEVGIDRSFLRHIFLEGPKFDPVDCEWGFFVFLEV